MSEQQKPEGMEQDEPVGFDGISERERLVRKIRQAHSDESELAALRAENKAQKELLDEARQLLRSYDGSRAIDQWDTDIMPSRKWHKDMDDTLTKLKNRKEGA